MEFFLTIHKNRNWGWVKQPCGHWRVDSFTTAMLCTGTMGVVYFMVENDGKHLKIMKKVPFSLCE